MTQSRPKSKSHTRKAALYKDPQFQAQVLALARQGVKRRPIAAQLGTSLGTVNRAYDAVTANGDHSAPESAPESAPTAALTAQEVVGEPVGAPDSAPYGAPRLNALEACVSVLEAFIATLQRQSPQMIGAPNGALRSAPNTPTKKRGFVIACNLSDALDAYAEASGLQVRDILDMALRRYLADVVGEEVHRG